jgi:putative YpdA family bacillithiol system oxidoreductase
MVVGGCGLAFVDVLGVGGLWHFGDLTGSFITYLFCALVIAVPFFLYVRSLRRKEARAREAAKTWNLDSTGPRAQHPHIDNARCIGCGTCTEVCPEGEVLALIGGKAGIVNPHKCIGHSMCADACPVGAITMVLAHPSMSADMPFLTPEYETSVRNLFIVGELGGLALIKNAVNQGRQCVDTIAQRLKATGPGKSAPGVYDVLIVGAGPGGISASLRAIENQLNYLTVEQDQIGGTVAKYPRQKLVLTSPVEFPIYGKFKKTELSKENLLTFWNAVSQRADFKPRTGEKVEDIKKDADGIFTVVTSKNRYRAHSVVLAIGKSGTPRKLGVRGEELPKVMYRLLETEAYTNKRILVVGGGDSAVEAAMGLAHQGGNQVTLSYRQGAFSRIKERNAQRIQECIRKGKVQVLFNSAPVEIKPESAVLNVNSRVQEIPNDYVWIFAGGTPPNEFLRKIGVQLGMRDLTQEASIEAKRASFSPRPLEPAALSASPN